MAEQERTWTGGKSATDGGEVRDALRSSGAEQDRYAAHFSGKLPSMSDIADRLPKTSGAEQDRYAAHFSDKMPSMSMSNITDRLPKTSGAEQDLYAAHFSGKMPSVSDITDRLPKTSGAEQDLYAAHFSGKMPSMGDITDRLPKTSGAEQDVYAAHFSGKMPSVSDITGRLPRTSGAEQDRYAAHFGGKFPPPGELSEFSDNLPKTSGAEQDRYEGWFGGKSISLEKINERITERLPRASGAEQDRLGSHFGPRPTNPAPVNATAVGLLQSAVLPSFGLHVGFAAVAYGVARYTNRVEVKDWLWPASMTVNAWWSAIGTRVVYDNLTLPEAWSTLNYTEKLLLGGVSAWGIRLLYSSARRSTKRGRDDPRYDVAKKDPNFWNNALFAMFIPEAISQALVSLPFTFPFRASLESATSSVLTGYNSTLHDAAIFLFSSGLALEVLANAQVEAHQQDHMAGVNREGAWSIIRSPNYLGDALIHASFPVLLLGSGILHPIVLVGPALNFLFLRYVGGEKIKVTQGGTHQDTPGKSQQPQDKNSIWGGLGEIQNKWIWASAAAGVGGVVLEHGIRTLIY